MIELHYAPTPNGHKIAIALEELGLDYQVHRVNIGQGDQFKPDFLAFSPNNRIPAIIDHDGEGADPVGVFESGAILMYLAEKTGRLLPAAGTARKTVIEWLMWQMGGVGPMFGQAHHFNFYAQEKIEYAMNRYSNESNRLYGVLERRLEAREFVADDFSIADIAIFPWTRTFERQGVDINDYPNVVRWRKTMFARPAVVRGMKVGAEWRDDLRDLSEDEWKKLFGA
jgi:GST-like protein